jgi:hemoglobin/transferrin/lactoferrin receptor protein
MMNVLNIENKAHAAIYDQMNIRLARQYFEESRHDRDLNASTKYNRNEKVDASSVNIDFTKSILEKQSFLWIGIYCDKVNSAGTVKMSQPG